jgi:hypothetical protein
VRRFAEKNLFAGTASNAWMRPSNRSAVEVGLGRCKGVGRREAWRPLPPRNRENMQGLFAVIRSVGALVLCAPLVACNGVEWKNPQVAAGYQPGNQLNVAIVATTKGEELREALDEFTTTLRDELKSNGIDVRFVQGAAVPPAAQLNVTSWDSGSRAVRYFIGFGSGQAHITVVVNVTRADGAPALRGQVRGYVKGGIFGGSSMIAPREAATAIAQAIASGKLTSDDGVLPNEAPVAWVVPAQPVLSAGQLPAPVAQPAPPAGQPAPPVAISAPPLPAPAPVAAAAPAPVPVQPAVEPPVAKTPKAAAKTGGASKAGKTAAKTGGCTMDTECKGDRICSNGACVDAQ